MPKHSKILRKIELTKEEREGLDLRNNHSFSKHIVKPSEVLRRYNPHAYDKLEEMNRQTSREGRTMELVHAQVREHSEKGKVVSFSNAGSGHRFFVNKVKLKTTKNTINVQDREGAHVLHRDTQEYVDAEEKVFGTEITGLKDKNGKPVDTLHVRRKVSTQEDGKSIVHVNMAGPLGKVAFLPKVSREGTLNSGKYEIDNLRSYIVQQGMEEVERILREEAEHPDAPHPPIHLDFRGHSRGGVATLEGAMALNYALHEKYGNQPEIYDRIKFDITQYDPVPGAGTRSGKREIVDLYGEPDDKQKLRPFQPGQVNSTVLYSMFQQHGYGLFIPEQVMGADRMIFTLTNHDVNLNKLEGYRSVQETEDGTDVVIADAENHRLGYQNTADGKKYRSSGLTALDQGIYIADENNNLVRIRNKEELKKVFDGILEQSGRQMGRYDNFLKMCNDWFDRHAQRLSLPEEEWQPALERRSEPLPGLMHLHPDRGNIEEVVRAARDSGVDEEDVAARLTRQNIEDRNGWNLDTPDFSPLKKEGSLFRYTLVENNALSNQREYLSRCAVKTMAAVASHDRDATFGIHLDGMDDAMAAAFFDHMEGSRESNEAFAQKYNQANHAEKGAILSGRLVDLASNAGRELRKNRSDEALVQDYDAIYGRMKNFDAMKQALNFMKDNGLLYPGVAQDLVNTLPRLENKWREADQRMAMIMDPCYRHIDLSKTMALPAKDFDQAGKENPRIRHYFKKANDLSRTLAAGRAAVIRNYASIQNSIEETVGSYSRAAQSAPEENRSVRTYANALTQNTLEKDHGEILALQQECEKVNRGAFIGSPEFRELRRGLKKMEKVFADMAASKDPDKEKLATLERICEDTVRVTILYQTMKQAQQVKSDMSASERTQNRIDFSERLTKFARAKLDQLSVKREELAKQPEQPAKRAGVAKLENGAPQM